MHKRPSPWANANEHMHAMHPHIPRHAFPLWRVAAVQTESWSRICSLAVAAHEIACQPLARPSLGPGSWYMEVGAEYSEVNSACSLARVVVCSDKRAQGQSTCFSRSASAAAALVTSCVRRWCSSCALIVASRTARRRSAIDLAKLSLASANLLLRAPSSSSNVST